LVVYGLVFVISNIFLSSLLHKAHSAVIFFEYNIFDICIFPLCYTGKDLRKNIDINEKKCKISREVLNRNRECSRSRDENEEEAYETFS